MKKKILKDLVYSRAWLPSSATVEEVLQYLRDHQLNYVPIVHDRHIFALVCLNRLQQALASPYGWSLLSKKSIYSMDLPKPLIFSVEGDWIDLLKMVINRPNDVAYDDVVLVHERKYLGLVSVRQLMIQQVKDHEKQMDKIVRQKELLKKTIATYLIDPAKESEEFDEKMRVVLKTAQKLESLDLHRKMDAVEEIQLSGQLDLFSCTDLIQLVVQGHKTGRLEIRPQQIDLEYSIFFEEGRITHAEGAGEIGKLAVWASLQCKKGDFVFYYDQSYPIHTIEEDPMHLLIEGCRMLDEYQSRSVRH